jgi:hypothetical protein
MSNGIKLFVDDVRNPRSSDWLVRRSVTGAIRVLATRVVSEVSLDHDIYCSVGTKCGHLSDETYQAVAFFISVMPEERRPRCVYVHSGNDEGAAKLLDILRGKVQILRRISPISGGLSFGR